MCHLRKRAGRVSQFASHGIQERFLHNGLFLRCHIDCLRIRDAKRANSKKKSRRRRDFQLVRCSQKENLGSAALTVAILVIFLVFVLALAAFFRLVLSGLVTLLRLSVLSGLSALLGLAVLASLAPLLALLFHIVCHKSFPPKESAGHPALFEFNCN
jgi:hypothetical protein